MRELTIAAVGALALLVSACSDSGGEKKTETTETPVAPAAAATPEQPAAAGATQVSELLAQRKQAKSEFLALREPLQKKRAELKAAKAAKDGERVARLEEELKPLIEDYDQARKKLDEITAQVRANSSDQPAQ